MLASWYAGVRTERKHSEEDRDWLRSELRQATDRLYAVSREPGAIIPPRTEELQPVPELPADLERLVADWESQDVQEALRHQFIQMLDEGLSSAEIKRRHLES